MDTFQIVKLSNRPKKIWYYPLSKLLAMNVDQDSLREMFKAFCCANEKDAVRFIQKKAIEYERNDDAETVLYLFGDDATINSLSLSKEMNGISLAGYFALSNVPTDYERETAGILIAQIARDDRWDGKGSDVRRHPFFDGLVMLYAAEMRAKEKAIKAYSYPGWTPESVPLYLDCKRSLRNYYEAHGYEQLYYDKKICRHKMFKRVSLLW